MHLIVLLQWPAAVDRAVASLSEHVGITASEARARMAGEPPRVAAAIAQREPANAVAEALRADGFVVAVLAASDIEHDAQRDVIASLAFGETEFEATLRTGRTRVVPYANITHIVQGARMSTNTTVEETKSRKFSAGRALMTGGLVLSKTTTTSTTRSNETRDPFVYVYEADDSPGLALYERRTNYAFLGSSLQPSAAANFAAVIDRLRKIAPHARFDSRLMRTPSIGFMPLAPPGVDPGEWKTDVAAALLRMV